jgi:hypothetical protein
MHDMRNSAYEEAKLYGFKGTYEDWLRMLV